MAQALQAYVHVAATAGCVGQRLRQERDRQAALPRHSCDGLARKQQLVCGGERSDCSSRSRSNDSSRV
jgi:hypothetical protein